MTNTASTQQRVSDSRQRRREAELALAVEVSNLLNRNESEGLCWQGSKVDLMEALYTAFTTGYITNEANGLGMSFRSIVARACRVLHVTAPHNPSSMARRGASRKSIVSRPYIETYERMRFNQGIDSPLGQKISLSCP